MKKLIFLIVLFFSYAFSAQENKTRSTENKKTTSVEVKKLEDSKMPEDANKDKNKINEKAKSENLEKEIYNLITIK